MITTLQVFLLCVYMAGCALTITLLYTINSVPFLFRSKILFAKNLSRIQNLDKDTVEQFHLDKFVLMFYFILYCFFVYADVK